MNSPHAAQHGDQPQKTPQQPDGPERSACILNTCIFLIAAISPGIALFVLRLPRPAEFLFRNHLPAPFASTAIWYSGISLIACVVLALVATSPRQFRSPLPSLAAENAKRFSPFVALPLLELAAFWPQSVTLLYRSAALLGAAPLTALALLNLAPPNSALRSGVFRLLNRQSPAALLTIVVTSLLCAIALAQYSIGLTASSDLAIYNNVIWNLAHGNWFRTSLLRGGNQLGEHCDLILLLLAPIYRLFGSSPRMLLVVQALAVGGAAWFLYLTGTKVLQSRAAGFVIILCFLLHPATHSAALFEFHSLILAMPLAAAALYFMQTEMRIGFCIAFLLLLTVRDDTPFIAGGIALLLLSREKSPRRGFIYLGIAGLYFLWIKLWVMTDSGVLVGGGIGSPLANRFKELAPRTGLFPEVLTTFATNPFYMLRALFQADKLQFLALFFGPLLFLPLLCPTALPLLAFGLIVTVGASSGLNYSVYTQYCTVMLPPALYLTAEAISKRSSRRKILLASIASTSVIFSSFYGGLVPNNEFKVCCTAGYWRRPPAELAARTALQKSGDELLAEIPAAESLGVTSRILSHASGRAAICDLSKCREAPKWILTWNAKENPAFKKEKAYLDSLKAHYTEFRQSGPLKLLERAGD